MKIKVQHPEHLPGDFSSPAQGRILCRLLPRNDFLVIFRPADSLVYLCGKGEDLYYCGEEETVEQIWQTLPQTEPMDMMERLWQMLAQNVQEQLTRLEKRLFAMEEALILTPGAQRSRGKELVSLRRELLTLRRYCGQMQTIAAQLKLSAGWEAVSQEILLLNEYLTQIREAWQAEMDLQLNRIMRFFTVLAALFLPPAMVTGWYGMNLFMPETQWRGLYPLLAVLLAVLTAAELIIFRKKRWI